VALGLGASELVALVLVALVLVSGFGGLGAGVPGMEGLKRKWHFGDPEPHCPLPAVTCRAEFWGAGKDSGMDPMGPHVPILRCHYALSVPWGTTGRGWPQPQHGPGHGDGEQYSRVHNV